MAFEILMDTITGEDEAEDRKFFKFLDKNAIKSEPTGVVAGGGWPETIYTCETREPLVKMLKKFFDDDGEYAEMIEEH